MDFDGDDKLDLLLYSADSGAWAQVFNSGGAGFTAGSEGRWEPGLSVVTSQSLTAGSLTNDAAIEPCASETDLKVPTGVATEIITFINDTRQNRKLYKLTSAGQREFVETILPGWEELVMTTRLQPWVVTSDSGACLGIYLPGDAANTRYWPNVVRLRQ